MDWRRFRQNMFPGIFGATDPMSQSQQLIDMGQSPSPSQDELDFNKEFMQSMIGNIGSTPKEEAIRAAAAGGGQKEFKTVPLSTTPEVAQYASTPGFSLVQPLKKKHWYNYG